MVKVLMQYHRQQGLQLFDAFLEHSYQECPINVRVNGEKCAAPQNTQT